MFVTSKRGARDEHIEFPHSHEVNKVMESCGGGVDNVGSKSCNNPSWEMQESSHVHSSANAVISEQFSAKKDSIVTWQKPEVREKKCYLKMKSRPKHKRLE